jgi:hypothetical protein
MTSKPKVEVAREHLMKAQEEAGSGDLRDAVQWSFASLEAAIDALAETRIAIDEKHWKRTRGSEAVAQRRIASKRSFQPASAPQRGAKGNVLRRRGP